MITSKNNPQLKKVRQLIEQNKERKKTGLFVVEGTRITQETPPELLENIYISESLFESGEFGVEGTNYEVVADDVFRSISDTVNPQGVMAIVKQPSYTMKDLESFKLFTILDDIRDPGNLGTIIRTSEAAGAAVIMSPNCTDIFNPKVTRSTMGTIFRVPFVKTELIPAIEELQAAGVKVFAAALDGAVFYNEAEYGERNAVIIGNEANGVSLPVQQAATGCIKIPMEGKVESLNAAISAAILLYNIKK